MFPKSRPNAYHTDLTARKSGWRLSQHILVLVMVLGSILLGCCLAAAIQSNNNYQLGQEVYLNNCASCHIPIPPEVLPTETWQEILEKPQNHYGQSLPRMMSLNIQLIWTYLRTFSRPLLPDEPVPEYATNSRYFRALHPQVDLPQPTTHQSCLLCHPGAKQLDYRSLTPEWETESAQ